MSPRQYTESQIATNPVWRHVKTGSLYHVVGVARCSTNGDGEGDLAVVYFSLDRQRLCYRDADEFLDGRFVPEPPAGPPAGPRPSSPSSAGGPP